MSTNGVQTCKQYTDLDEPRIAAAIGSCLSGISDPTFCQTTVGTESSYIDLQAVFSRMCLDDGHSTA